MVAARNTLYEYALKYNRKEAQLNFYRNDGSNYSDTKLIRFGARDYDPTIGRWTTKDPIGLAGGLNQYEYANSNPMTMIDPRGTDSERVISFTFGFPHEYLHIFDPRGKNGYSYWVDLGPTDGAFPVVKSLFGDVSAVVNISSTEPSGILYRWDYKKSSVEKDANTLLNSVEAMISAVRGDLKYNFFEFSYDKNSKVTNCMGFSSGVRK